MIRKTLQQAHLELKALQGTLGTLESLPEAFDAITDKMGSSLCGDVGELVTKLEKQTALLEDAVDSLESALDTLEYAIDEETEVSPRDLVYRLQFEDTEGGLEALLDELHRAGLINTQREAA